MEGCGRGQHKRRKKGARRNFFRVKNCERKRQEANLEQRRKCDAEKENQGALTFEDLKKDMIKIDVPDQWVMFSSECNIQWSKIDITHNGLREPVISVLLQHDFSWRVHAYGKIVPQNSAILSIYSPALQSPDIMKNLIERLHRAKLCPGNPDEHFVTLCEKKGGTIDGNRGPVAYIDKVPVMGSDGQNYPCTVRRVECELLCQRSSDNPARCQYCQSHRPVLRKAISRNSNSSASTAASSHTNYIHLTPAEKNERMRNLQQSLKISKYQRKRLESRLEQRIEKESIALQPQDNADLVQVVREVAPLVEERFSENSAQRIFWQQQEVYNKLQNKRSMRWHPLVLRFALNLKYMSTSAYRAVRESGIINLPSERTLYDYTHWSSPHSGVQLEYIQELHGLLSESLPPHQHHCALSMDEMKIKSGLVFSKHSGRLVGFVDLGVNEDIEKVVTGEQDEPKSEKQLASQTFVLMARSIFKPSLSVTIAHYFSCNLKGMCACVCVRLCAFVSVCAVVYVDLCVCVCVPVCVSDLPTPLSEILILY